MNAERAFSSAPTPLKRAALLVDANEPKNPVLNHLVEELLFKELCPCLPDLILGDAFGASLPLEEFFPLCSVVGHGVFLSMQPHGLALRCGRRILQHHHELGARDLGGTEAPLRQTAVSPARRCGSWRRSLR